MNVKDSSVGESAVVKLQLPEDEFSNIILRPLDRSENEISKQKYDDLISSLSFITDESHHDFYKSLKYSSDSSFEPDYALACTFADDKNVSD